MKNREINNQIILLCKKYPEYFSGSEVYAPMFYDYPKGGGILFIGMNPSVPGSKTKKIVNKDERESLKWNNEVGVEEKVDKLIKLEKRFVDDYFYFKKMKEIRDFSGLQSNHLQHADLFVYRETKQPEFIKKIKTKRKLNEFAEDQLRIFDKLLDLLSPEVIVIANAEASKIFQDRYSKSISKFMDDKGHHLFKDKTPIFFSSMISGQRALDNGSFERLKWHIKKSISSKK